MSISLPIQIGCFCLIVCILFYFAIPLTTSSSYKSTFNRLPRRPILIFAATKYFGSNVTNHSILPRQIRFFRFEICAGTIFFPVYPFLERTKGIRTLCNERFLASCSSKDWCSISEDDDDLPRSDAVIFHNRDFNANHTIRFKERNSDVPYVLWGRESPTNDHFGQEEDFINWTMTYRQDADVWYPYGLMERRENSSSIDFESIWSSKNQSLPPATWLSSNCQTANDRMRIVERMERKGLGIDKWGACGRPAPNCDGLHTYWDQCTVDLIKQYKFYLAFENSNCVDYVTEKFFDTMRTRQAVPVVLQREIYEDLGLLPSSFIALSDYSSVAEAVREINRIANDKEAYLEYHKWRVDYEILPEDNDESGFCLLCKKLAERSHLSPMERLSSLKSYKSVQSWHADGMCDNSIKFY